MTTDAWEYRAGDEVQYAVTLTNEGNATLSLVSVSDKLTGEPAKVRDWRRATRRPSISATRSRGFEGWRSVQPRAGRRAAGRGIDAVNAARTPS
jgi:uncharacterized repeat protein (TIGR01451 family)